MIEKIKEKQNQIKKAEDNLINSQMPKLSKNLADFFNVQNNTLKDKQKSR